MTIAACLNVYNDALALQGALESAARYFDNIFVIHSGPGGALSTDGTLEILEDFGIKPVFADIAEGFGVIRTRLIHECGCDWAFLLDADERFFPFQRVLRCAGTDRFPAVQEPKLRVTEYPNLVSPGLHLRDLIRHKHFDAIKTIRRHWFDFSMKRPCENWEQIKDWQMRIVRNVPHVGFERGTRMHERLIDYRIGQAPAHFTADGVGEPVHDHFHMHFRHARPGHKEANEANYRLMEAGQAMMPTPFTR